MESFYDIEEQTKYRLTVHVPENMEDLSDLFITKSEIKEIIGPEAWVYESPGSKQSFLLHSTITAEVMKWAGKLEASGKKTLVIEDEELLDVLKNNHLSYFTENDTRFGRTGNRICYARQFKRKKTKVTQGDVNHMWQHLQCAWRDKYGCYLTHIPRYDRSPALFESIKDVVGWRRVRKSIGNASNVKFYRLIWDNPQEYM